MVFDPPPLWVPSKGRIPRTDLMTMAETLSNMIDAMEHDEDLEYEAYQLRVIRDKQRAVAEKR